eukprot:CAMPEP_0113689634 /NCGR_PEP_ID=MMETSP0038_2-20120614/17297_1 /TAXON_ID=2898 /ORGANISM="Cryptomonas paramecium" /LENGTH=419 /DNA_ID=CAMNT_0000610775 /DNA_START=22 /DNA_END=1278 /DNA_ORIENTATION=+ /assembly_acc=CAM_ASM_000170
MNGINGHAEAAAQEVATPGARAKNTKQQSAKPKSGKESSNKQSDGVTVQPSNSEVTDVVEDEKHLTPPQPVAEPDSQEFNEKMNTIRASINALESRVTEVAAEIAKVKEVKDAQHAGLQELKTELSSLRSVTSRLAQDKDDLNDQLRKMSEAIKAKDQAAAKLRKELKFRTEEETDLAIQQLSIQLETSTLELKREKEIMKEMKKLNSDKEQIRQYHAILHESQAMRAGHEDLFLQRQAKSNELAVVREQERMVLSRMDDLRSGKGAPGGFNAFERTATLQDERTRLIQSIKEARAAQQELVVAFKLKQAEYRDYKKAQVGYEARLERIEMRKRRAEALARQERAKEERRQRDAERRETKRREEQRMLAVAQGCQLYVGGLTIRCDDEALRAHFARFGEVTDALVIREPDTKLSRGFAF